MVELISIVDAAMMLQPFIGELNALHLLVDWRRKKPRYRKRLHKPPRGCTHEGVVRYDRAEIERAIQELVMFRLVMTLPRTALSASKE